MSNKNILDFVAAVASGQPAAAVEFAKAELQARTNEAMQEFSSNYTMKVGENKNGTE